MKTSKSGYMTRKLVDATQEVVIIEEDCHTHRGLEVNDIIDTKNGSVIEPMYDRMVGRYSLRDIVSPKTKKVLVHENELITPEIAKAIEDAGIKSVTVRSPLHCLAINGVCQKCFGLELSTNEIIQQGTAIGVIAAQSIGEPGTQLTMRTFHTGGVAGGSNITQGFERLKQLFDIIPPKPWERAIISEIDGVVDNIEQINNNTEWKISIKNKVEEIHYVAPINAKLRVKIGDTVAAGAKITEGSIEITELLKVAGIEAVRNYIIKEVQKVYRLQGIEISDKYIEIIIRQLTNKGVIVNSGDSNYFVGQVVDLNKFQIVCQDLWDKGKRNLPVVVNQVFGLYNAPSKSGSFLSAASFQDTKKTLTDAAFRAQVDNLIGLKENVILGKLIPAGTGRENTEQILADGAAMKAKEY